MKTLGSSINSDDVTDYIPNV